MEFFNKILISHWSPENGCNVNEGEVLIIFPSIPKNINQYKSHYFVSSQDNRAKSKYGFVKDLSEFSLEEFLENYYHKNKLTDEIISHVEIMLKSIKSLPEDTPIAVDYNERGLLEKKIELWIHKVFFYKTK